MELSDIYDFFLHPRPMYLNKETAACYVLYQLTERGDSYATALIEQIPKDYPQYRLSDTILYCVLRFLEDEKIIFGYWKNLEGRGRPRRMYRISPEKEQQARELADLWLKYIHHL